MTKADPNDVANAATTLPAALDLASKGFEVFPVWGVTPQGNCTCGREKCKHAARGKPGKRPAVAKWPQVATIDPERIREWWKKRPNANIGIHARGRSC
jgi:hypothetical protein